jgi:plasmid stability protein
MPTLTIKGVPEAVYRSLKRRAALHRRSLNSEVIVCLEQAANLPSLDPHLWLREADRLRDRLELSPLTETRLRRAKNTGRP